MRAAEALAAQQCHRVAPLEHRTLVIDNPNLAGVAIEDIPSRAETGVIVSRHRPVGETEVRVAAGGTLLRQGDSILAVGTPDMLDKFQRVVGRRSDEDLYRAPGKVAQRRIVVTNKDVLGKTVGELALDARCGAVVSRVTRADIELTAVPGLRLQFGDMVRVAGDDEALARTERLLGNSVKELNETHFIAFFLGILGGIVVGTAPIALPGLAHPVRLGLAGGPLLVALVLGRFGRIGRLVCHMPVNANLAFREFGIALFFAAVGLGAGRTFFASVFSTSGLALARRRPVRHRPAAAHRRRVRASGPQDELHRALRPAGRQHDRPSCARLRDQPLGVRCADDRLRHRLPADHAVAHPHRAGPRPDPDPMMQPRGAAPKPV